MFCEELKKFRKEKGLTSMELGKKIGLSPTSIIRHENPGAVCSFWRYTRKLNSVFGTDFPDMSVCRVCGCEFEGRGRQCPECAKKRNLPQRREVVSLQTAAQEAHKANLSYGEYSAEITNKARAERNNKAPAF